MQQHNSDTVFIHMITWLRILLDLRVNSNAIDTEWTEKVLTYLGCKNLTNTPIQSLSFLLLCHNLMMVIWIIVIVQS